MRRFTYLIGTAYDFESYEDLKACYLSGDHNFGDYNASAFTFEIPDVGTDSLTVRQIATYIGYGMAFESNWCMDDTVSTLLEE